jgi:hypothetical protein
VPDYYVLNYSNFLFVLDSCFGLCCSVKDKMLIFSSNFVHYFHACRFTLKNRNGQNGDPETMEITVYDYFVNKGTELRYSGDYPCINVGKPKRPTYFPIEVLATF